MNEREDFITQNWANGESELREPWMDARPEPLQRRGHFDPGYESILKEGQKTGETILLEAQQFELKMLKESLNRLVMTEDGYRVFRWLVKYLAFKDSVLAMVNGKFDLQSMVYNEARRIIWKDIRDMLSIYNRNRLEEDA